MEQAQLPEWESEMIDDAITQAESRLEKEKTHARRRAVQLAREQGYHRLAVAIDHPAKVARHPGQLTLFGDDPTLFDDAG